MYDTIKIAWHDQHAIDWDFDFYFENISDLFGLFGRIWIGVTFLDSISSKLSYIAYNVIWLYASVFRFCTVYGLFTFAWINHDFVYVGISRDYSNSKLHDELIWAYQFSDSHSDVRQRFGK